MATKHRPTSSRRTVVQLAQDLIGEVECLMCERNQLEARVGELEARLASAHDQDGVCPSNAADEEDG